MLSKSKSRYITSKYAGTKKDTRLLLENCKAFGLNFIEMPHSLLDKMKRFADLYENALDKLVLGESKTVQFCEAAVRENLSCHLAEIKGSMVSIIEQLEELGEEIARDQKVVRVIDDVIKTAIDKECSDNEWDKASHGNYKAKDYYKHTDYYNGL